MLKLRPDTFTYKKGFRFPYPRYIYEAIVNFYKRNYPKIRWDSEIELARQDFERTKKWGLLPTDRQDRLLYIKNKHYSERLSFSNSMLAWGLIYPDLMLSAYPVKPLGSAIDLSGETSVFTLNPYYLRPSEWWELPSEIYEHFMARCGDRFSSVKYNAKRIEAIEKQRGIYVDYFCKKAKVPRKLFYKLESKPSKINLIID